MEPEGELAIAGFHGRTVTAQWQPQYSPWVARESRHGHLCAHLLA